MKIFTSSEIKISDSFKKTAYGERRKDGNGRPLEFSQKYFLRKKKMNANEPYFFGGGSLHSPELVWLADEAFDFDGSKLNSSTYDWTQDWDAVSRKSPPINKPLEPRASKTERTERTAQIEQSQEELRPEIKVEKPAPSVNPLDGKTNTQARRITNHILYTNSLGLFSDEYWAGPKKIFDAMNQAGLDWNLTSTQYGVSKSHQSTYTGEKWRIPNDYKEWRFEIKYTNKVGKPSILNGVLTAHGAGSVSDPLSKYDMSVYVT